MYKGARSVRTLTFGDSAGRALEGGAAPLFSLRAARTQEHASGGARACPTLSCDRAHAHRRASKGRGVTGRLCTTRCRRSGATFPPHFHGRPGPAERSIRLRRVSRARNRWRSYDASGETKDGRGLCGRRSKGPIAIRCYRPIVVLNFFGTRVGVSGWSNAIAPGYKGSRSRSNNTASRPGPATRGGNGLANQIRLTTKTTRGVGANRRAGSTPTTKTAVSLTWRHRFGSYGTRHAHSADGNN